MSTATIEVAAASLPVDEHLAKFPPFKGLRIGGNFEVDDNILAGMRQSIREIPTCVLTRHKITSSSRPRNGGFCMSTPTAILYGEDRLPYTGRQDGLLLSQGSSGACLVPEHIMGRPLGSLG